MADTFIGDTKYRDEAIRDAIERIGYGLSDADEEDDQ